MLVALLAVLAAGAAYGAYVTVRGTPSLASLEPLPLAGHQRVLVLAPHCDDETLGAAGLIQAALQAGMEVRLVLATNGDGYFFATMDDFHRLYPTAADFVRMGNVRQQESLAAMQVLGLPPDQVTFLSYPDRGTPLLWNTNWLADDPYHSPYTEDNHSPYPATYDPQAVYAGEDYLADVRAILASYQPDLVIYPHPDDIHPDHWGLSAFARLAVALQEQADPAFRPDLYAYLVHRPDYPSPRGLQPAQALLPPDALYALDPDVWYRLDLGQAQVQRKQQAVDAYKSQLPLLKGLMDSFIRSNEVFAHLRPAVLTTLAAGDPTQPDTWQDTQGNPVAVTQKDPVRDFFTRAAIAAADLDGVYAARTAQHALRLCGQVRAQTRPELVYRLSVLAVSEQGIVHRHWENRGSAPAGRVSLDGANFCVEVSLADLGDPWLVFVGADVQDIGVGILDQAAWQQVNVRPGPGP